MKNLTEEEIEVLVKFRAFVESLNYPKQFEDFYLLRFLKARKFDFDQAKIMFNAFLEFRKKYDVENNDSFVFHELEDVKKFYPHGFHNTDKFVNFLSNEGETSLYRETWEFESSAAFSNHN